MSGFLFFLGLRGFVNTDWINYYMFFDELQTLGSTDWENIVSNNYNMESGFVLSSVIFKSIIPNYFAWIFVSTLIDIYVLNLFFKQYVQYYVLGFILFYVFGGLIMEVNLLRNMKSIMLFLLSLKYLKENKWKVYMLLNILGCFFHITSIVYLILYFVLKREISYKIMWCIFILGNLFFLLQIQYIKPIMIFCGDLIDGRISYLINFYFESEVYSKAYGLSIGYFERCFTFLLIMFYYKRLVANNRDNIIFINVFLIYISIFLYFSEMQILLERLSLLFIFSYWILYPRIYSLINLKFNRSVFLILLICYSCMKLISLNNNIIQKYDNLLFGIESYEQRRTVFDYYSDEIIL